MSIQNAAHGIGNATGGYGSSTPDPQRLKEIAEDMRKGVELAAGIVDKRESADQISKVLNERGARYGDFTHHAEVCQSIKNTLLFHRYSKYGQLSADKKQALDVIADKIARILTGDPEYDDNWIDIQGYAKLAQERLRKEAVCAPAPQAAAQPPYGVGQKNSMVRGDRNYE